MLDQSRINIGLIAKLDKFIHIECLVSKLQVEFNLLVVLGGIILVVLLQTLVIPVEELGAI